MPSDTMTNEPVVSDVGPGEIPLVSKKDVSGQCRVLVVDENELVLAKLAHLLTRADYDVRVAKSGDEAMGVLNQTPCRIVLSDWRMPRVDGLELCRLLRAREDGDYVYFLLLTARNTKPDILAGLAAGADDYIAKDAPPEEIIARLGVGRRITRLERSLRVSNRETERLAVTDELTGVHNRRYLMKYLPREVERSRRHRRPLAVLSCDIDRFKLINDEFGHEAGDEVLQELAARFAECLRESTDWVARTGGEEFMIVLPETGLRGAASVAEKLHRSLGLRPVRTREGSLTITMSIGLTALETDRDFINASVAELMHAADRCLYLSKRLGRDRTTAAPVTESGAASPLLPPRAPLEVN